ncbi:hypothetical protein SC1_03196 [Sphingopyxis sp. C-1]|nr:hypothetical protein SC1_03196 [Sphingopyxis sp. C-1]
MDRVARDFGRWQRDLVQSRAGGERARDDSDRAAALGHVEARSGRIELIIGKLPGGVAGAQRAREIAARRGTRERPGEIGAFALPLRERMIGRADEHEWLGRQWDAQHFVGVGGCRELSAVADNQIETTVDERFEKLLRRPARHGDADAGVRGGKARDRVGEQRLQRIGAAADRDGAAGRMAEPARFLFEIRRRGDDVAGGADQAVGVAGRADIMGRSVEQGRAKLFLELLDRARERRLRETEFVGGARVASEAVERVEMAKAAEVHGPHHIIPIMQYQCTCDALSVSA